MKAHFIEEAIRRATSEGRPALAAFLTAGYPAMEGFSALVGRVAREVDLVEIGVPFSDPLADGVTIQRSSRRALVQGVTLDRILDLLAGVSCPTPLVLMSYLNPLLSFGIERLVEEAGRAGVSGCIVPDLPFEECTPLRARLDEADIALIQLVSPVTSSRRLERLCQASRGFVYAVTVTGTTGGPLESSQLSQGYLQRVRAAASIPVLAGFGLRSAEQLRLVTAHADGAIVGSALIEAIEQGQDPVAFLRGLRPGRAAATRAGR